MKKITNTVDHRACGTQFGRAAVQAFHPAAAMTALGQVIYAVDLDGIIKIGCTSDLGGRLRTLRYRNKAINVEVLAFMLGGTVEQEQAIHAKLGERNRAHSREYYRPTDEVLAVVNEMRQTIGLPSVAA